MSRASVVVRLSLTPAGLFFVLPLHQLLEHAEGGDYQADVSANLGGFERQPVRVS